MECYNFLFIWEENKFPIQIIKLLESFFIYIGKQNFSFENLSLCNSMSGETSNNCHTFIDDEYSEIGKSLANKLGIFIIY